MIPKDKGGGDVKPWTMGGGNPCVTTLFDFLSSLVSSNHFNVCGVVEAVMAGSGVWQDCQSFPTRTLHQQVDLMLVSKPPPFYK